MARKIKPNKLFDDAQNVASNIETNANSESINNASEAEMLGVDANPVVGNGRMSAEDVEKLAKYDAMEKSLIEISIEKDKLEATVAEYIEKIEALKNADSLVKKLEDEKTSLEDKCKKLEDEKSKLSKLEKENATLKDENDQYLIKISELTFENANLSNQLSNINNKANKNGNGINQNKFGINPGMQPQCGRSLAKPYRDAYNPYINNGYGSW